MTTSGRIRTVLLTTLAVGLVTYQPQLAESKEAKKTVLSATLKGKEKMTAKAQYQSAATFRRFAAKVSNAQPGEILIFVARRGSAREKIGWVRVDLRGRAELKLDSRFDYIPELRHKDMLELWRGKSLALKGRLVLISG